MMLVSDPCGVRPPSRSRPQSRNLSRRPLRPSHLRGPVQRGVWRAFVMTGREALSTSELKTFVYCLRQHRDGHVDRELCRSIRRVAARLCVRAGRASTIGHPWRWALKPEYRDCPPWRVGNRENPSSDPKPFQQPENKQEQRTRPRRAIALNAAGVLSGCCR
jgi:hypothetical protein